MAYTPARVDGRVRVLVLVKGLGPGGAERLLLESARVADRERFDYRIAYVRPDKTHLVADFRELSIPTLRLGSGSAGRSAWLASLRGLMSGADVVHAHSPVLAGVARLLALTLPSNRRPVLVSTEHNEWTSHRLPTRLLNALTAPLDAYHWAVSDEVAATVTWPTRREMHVLTHGIDLSGIRPEAVDREGIRATLDLADDAVLVLTVANLRRTKDYPNLLAAAAIAAEEEPHLVFAAVGQGPLEGEIRALRDHLGLGDRFHLLGYRTDVRDLLAASDIFVLGSAHEGLPVAIMEALATGLPVVATAVGGVPEAITSGTEGILVPSADPEALATAVVALARDPELRARMSASARERGAEFDIRNAVREQEGVYLRLLGRGGAT